MHQNRKAPVGDSYSSSQRLAGAHVRAGCLSVGSFHQHVGCEVGNSPPHCDPQTRQRRAPVQRDFGEAAAGRAGTQSRPRTVTTDAAVSEWLSKPEQALGNIAPLDLLDTDFGAREVENLLRSLAYGQFV